MVIAVAPTAPSPVPLYISIGNVSPYLSQDKVEIADNVPTAIPTALANELIATGENMVIIKLSPYYITEPMLMTKNGGSWLTLPTTSLTYRTLYDLFILQASIQLIGWFIARNSDMKDDTLSYFQNYVEVRKNKFDKFADDLLNSGNYRYNLFPDLKINPIGIKRTVTKYARAINLNDGSYTGGQLTNPQQTFDAYWSKKDNR